MSGNWSCQASLAWHSRHLPMQVFFQTPISDSLHTEFHVDSYKVKTRTLTSKMCDNTLAKFQANLSDLPVSVANKTVAFVRFNKASLIKKQRNEQLWRGKKSETEKNTKRGTGYEWSAPKKISKNCNCSLLGSLRQLLSEEHFMARRASLLQKKSKSGYYL